LPDSRHAGIGPDAGFDGISEDGCGHCGDKRNCVAPVGRREKDVTPTERQRSNAKGTEDAVQHCLSDKRRPPMPLFWLPLILYAGLMDLLLTPPETNK
jgi:hypothetical protein